MTELASALGFTKKKDIAFVVKSVMEVSRVKAGDSLHVTLFDATHAALATGVMPKCPPRQQVADLDDDGVISYEEFLPVAIDIVQVVVVVVLVILMVVIDMV